jgi:hypothetical protein
LLSVALALAAAIPVLAQQEAKPKLKGILTSDGGRLGYLGKATLWQQPPALTPQQLMEGPPGVFHFTYAASTSPDGIACTFSKPGNKLGGKSPKFECRTAEDHKLEVKYWDRARQSGNREVFAMVAATRLMWALGFATVPAYPINLHCAGCPENPMDGSGRPDARAYQAVWQADLPGPAIQSEDKDKEGWTWRELHEAIQRLPQGPERTERLTHFEALTLLGVFLQHGDRKAQQQRMYCADMNPSAGGRETEDEKGRKWLVEQEGTKACNQAAAVLVDLGATFGGAGRTSNPTTAKMYLDSWREEKIFANDSGSCKGNLTISFAAHDGEGNPSITEEGRVFLLEQLRRLTPDHVRALFTASQVDRLPAATSPTAIDDWIAVFQDKVRQIDGRHCQNPS